MMLVIMCLLLVHGMMLFIILFLHIFVRYEKKIFR